MGNVSRARIGLTSGALALLVGMLALTSHAGAETTVPVLTGLHNPRGVAAGPADRMFVAESGTGAPGSGRISQWWRGNGSVVVGGLDSIHNFESSVSGPAGISLTGLGQLFFTYGGGSDQLQFSSLQRAAPHLRLVADIRAFDAAHPEPNAGPPDTDSNAYGIAVLADGSVLVADAAANNLKRVSASGAIQVVARFPHQLVPHPFIPSAMIPAQAVPTSVAVGPDGWWYVGELKGFPFPQGKARVWKVRPDVAPTACDPAASAAADCQLVAGDFTAIVGVAFGADGSMYVSEMARNGLLGFLVLGDGSPFWTEGALIKVAPGGTRSELAAGQLTLAGGVAVAGDGSVYVVNLSISDNQGSLLKINE